MAVLWLSFTINFLDRQILAAVAPTLKEEFHLSNTNYGELISGFYLVYAITTPFAGWFLDRVSLRAGAAIAVAIWSLAGSATVSPVATMLSKWSAPTGIPVGGWIAR